MNFVSKDMRAPEFIDIQSFSGTRFLITVDTEEEFNWDKPFTRDQHGTSHIGAIARFQTLCERSGVKPVYLVDYPIADDPKAVELLGGYAHHGKADIGVQLHPWVNPPFREVVNLENSYACNLPAELEREKLNILHDKIIDSFALKPDIYRAGRYGAGRETPKILEDLGISIDTSVRSLFDYAKQGGPDYRSSPVNPYWVKKNKLLELPVTTVFRGGLRKFGSTVFWDMFASARSRSLMARTGMLERIALTPEGIPLHKAIEGVDCAIEQNVAILNFSFHSPSLEPGHTNYVRDEDDLSAFYNWWEGMFDHLQKRGVMPITVEQIKSVSFK